MSRRYCGARLRDMFGRVSHHRVWVEHTEQYGRDLHGEFGWGKSCPAAHCETLAWAILTEAGGDEERVEPWVRLFAAEFVARWPERWTVTEDTVIAWLLARERQALADEVTQRLLVAAGVRDREENNGQNERGAGGGMGPPGSGRGDTGDGASPGGAV
jgi:hypothetical protein